MVVRENHLTRLMPQQPKDPRVGKYYVILSYPLFPHVVDFDRLSHRNYFASSVYV